MKKKSTYRLTKQEKEAWSKEYLAWKKLETPSVPDKAIVIKWPEPESQANFWERFILRWARNRKFSASKVDVRGVYRKGIGMTKTSSTRGVADTLLCIHGFYVAVEVKGKGDVQSDEQKAWQKKHEDAGGIYYLFENFCDGVAFLELTAEKIKTVKTLMNHYDIKLEA